MSSAAEFTTPASVNRRVLGAVSAVTLAVVTVKLVAVLKEFAVAGVYGRSDAYEAFLTAALVPALLVNLISESMSQSLIPTFVRVKEQEGRERAQALLSNALVATIVLLGIASLAVAFSARWFFPLIGSHFSPAKLHLAVQLFIGLLPVVFLAGVASNCTAVLNTTGRFGLPALAPVAGPLAVIAIIPLFGGAAGIWAMVYATVAGALIHCAWVAAMMHRTGYRLKLRWCGLDEGTAEVARQYGPVLLSGVVASGGLLVDQAMAAMLPAGSVAALAYGGRFCERGSGAPRRIGFVSGNASLLRDGGARRMGALPKHTPLLGMDVGRSGRAGQLCSYRWSAHAGSPDVAARCLRHAGQRNCCTGSGNVCAPDSVLCVQPRVLSIPDRDATHRSGVLLRANQSRSRCCAESAAHARDGSGRHCAGNVVMDGEHSRLSWLLELESPATKRRLRDAGSRGLRFQLEQ